jgi:transcriptional regulator with XRE-family HTH domain
MFTNDQIMKDTVCVAFGKRIRTMRKMHGWSQEVLAEKAGLHPTYIGGIERGERNPSLINLARLAKALKVPLSDLMQVSID